jgi:hypothetical protein
VLDEQLIIFVLLVTLCYLLPMVVGVSLDTNWSDWKEGMFPKIATEVGGAGIFAGHPPAGDGSQ